MNQEKIGRFISECRKEKNMTQQALAERLGVSDKTIGNWENGRNMPDLSLFKPLCVELDITINEFLSGERIKENYQEKFEENIINTIDYSTKKINLIRNNLGIVLFILGIFISFTALSIIPSDSSWGSIYSIIGAIISTIGVSKLLKKINRTKKILTESIYFILFIIFLILYDYISVVTYKQVPRFSLIKKYNGNVYECETLFLNYFKVNVNTNNEYIIVDTKKEYNISTIPNVIFNRNKSGIDNIIKYKNKYIGNNSNTGNLISNLPLSEFGYVFEIDSKNNGLTIDYHITDWYINEDKYLEKALLYNTVSIFSLIDNIEYIKYNFSGNTYIVKKCDVIKYPYYKDIVNSKDAFNKYLEKKMNDTDFTSMWFNNLLKTKNS
ncbi:MAG: DUF4825 domain-containing protein [Bacilli bacterium]|nr:DUF4825 domain-containing protein [Bacilli bacterium]